MKISGEGMKRRGKPGDLLVRVKIVTPKSVSSEQKELYVKLAELEGKSSGSGDFSPYHGKKEREKVTEKFLCAYFFLQEILPFCTLI